MIILLQYAQVIKFPSPTFEKNIYS